MEDGEFLFDFDRDFEDGRDQDDGFETVFEMERDFLELADEGVAVGMGTREEGVKILEEEDGRIDLFDDLVKRGEWIACWRVAILLELNGSVGDGGGGGGVVGKETGGAAPFVEGLLAALGDGGEETLDALFLRREDINDGIASADESFEFLGEVGRHGGIVKRDGSEGKDEVQRGESKNLGTL
jgi:hypothetical protein